MPRDKEDDKKVFDVTKPGQTAASASGRPVIVGHKTLLPDPMVTKQPSSDKRQNTAPDSYDDAPDEHASGEPDVDIKLLPPPEMNITQPESSQSTDQDTGTLSTSSPVDIGPEDTKTTGQKSSSEPVTDTTDEPEKTNDNSDNISGTDFTPLTSQILAEPDKPEDDNKTTDQPKDPKENEASKATVKTAQDTAYKKLVENKTYFVPIGEQKHRRSMRRLLLIIILLLLLVIIGADLLIDNGTIKTSIKPPISIFHKN